MPKIFKKFLPFWIFLVLFRFGACIHFDLMSTYGGSVFPLWFAGLMIGSASLLQLTLDIPAGFILDRFGYKKFLMVTCVLFMVSASSLFFGLNKYSYLATLFLGSFGWLFFGPGVDAYIWSHAADEDTGKFLSFRDMSESMGVVLSGAVLIVTLLLPVRWVAIIIISLLMLALFFLYRSPKDAVEFDNQRKKTKTRGQDIRQASFKTVIRAILRLNPASVILIITGLSSSIFYGIIWFVIPLAVANANDGLIMGMSLGTFDLAVFLTGMWIGKVVDKFNKRVLVFWGLLVFSIMGLMLGFSFGVWFILIGFLATVGDELSRLSLWAWLNFLDRDNTEDGMVSGTISMFQDLGWAIGPMIAGVLYTKIGPQFTLLIGGVIVLIGWLVYSLKFVGLNNLTKMDLSSLQKKLLGIRYKR